MTKVIEDNYKRRTYHALGTAVRPNDKIGTSIGVVETRNIQAAETGSKQSRHVWGKESGLEVRRPELLT